MVSESSDFGSNVFREGDLDVSANLLAVSAHARFVCPFRYPRGSQLLLLVSDHLTACLAALFLGALVCASVPCDDRVSELFLGTDFLHLG